VAKQDQASKRKAAKVAAIWIFATDRETAQALAVMKKISRGLRDYGTVRRSSRSASMRSWSFNFPVRPIMGRSRPTGMAARLNNWAFDPLMTSEGARPERVPDRLLSKSDRGNP
jgi:hypothetical protein